MVEVSGELRIDRPKAWGIWTGDYEDSAEDDDSKRRELLVWLPKSQCQQGDNATTWMVPEWLAQEKELI